MLKRTKYIILAASLPVLVVIALLFIRTVIAVKEERKVRNTPIANGTIYFDKVMDPFEPFEGEWSWSHKLAVRFGVFSIQVDNLPAVYVTTANRAMVTNLAINKPHIVKIRLNGRPHSSFWMNFQDYPSTTLHLFYYIYQDWIFNKHPKVLCDSINASDKRCQP